jgi:hypothetical protein
LLLFILQLYTNWERYVIIHGEFVDWGNWTLKWNLGFENGWMGNSPNYAVLLEIGQWSACWQSSHLHRRAISSLTYHTHNSRLEVEEGWAQNPRCTAQAQIQGTELLCSIALPSIYTSLVSTIWYASTWLSSASQLLLLHGWWLMYATTRLACCYTTMVL